MNEMSLSVDDYNHKPVHPSLFTILILPMGVSAGYVTVTLGYLLSQAGISVEKNCSFSWSFSSSSYF
jgi:hypothetical protein